MVNSITAMASREHVDGLRIKYSKDVEYLKMMTKLEEKNLAKKQKEDIEVIQMDWLKRWMSKDILWICDFLLFN